MCGIAGFLAPPRAWEGAEETLRAMADALVHRGPDGEGFWLDPRAGAALASRRLRIIDLTPAGDQPMHSPCGRYALVHNGEVYNFPALRAELEAAGHRFRGGSDTEVVAAALTRWGVAGALPRLNGMYALAIWDREERALELVRDRLGQKPLYYGRAADGSLLFASELGAFHRHPAFRPEIERRALPLLLRRGCVLDPWTIYQGVWKLPPGCRLRVPAGAGDLPAPEPYWSAAEALERGAAEPFTGGLDDGADTLEELLAGAVAGCSLSDVPLGALLSGGVDSSTVVALMRARAGARVRTYSIGFAERRFDESVHAARVAAHLGCEHTELRVTEDDALALVPDLARIYDEPFADPSQVPTCLVARLARRHVTVALTGDGGDEVFGGYPRYRQLAAVARLGRLPAPTRRALAAAARRVASEKAARLADALGVAPDPDRLVTWFASLWRDPESAVRGAAEPPSALTDPARWPALASPVRRSMAVDALGFLPSDVLVKVDRASMAVSLETRAPLLDHRVFELAARFPLSWLRGKAVLRRVLHRHVPRALVERPKMGFDVPLDAWLRGRLRGWADDLLAADRLARDGFFEPAPIAALWSEHRRGARDRGALLWPVLMFQAWLDAERGRERTPAPAAELAAVG